MKQDYINKCCFCSFHAIILCPSIYFKVFYLHECTKMNNTNQHALASDNEEQWSMAHPENHGDEFKVSISYPQHNEYHKFANY